MGNNTPITPNNDSVYSAELDVLSLLRDNMDNNTPPNMENAPPKESELDKLSRAKSNKGMVVDNAALNGKEKKPLQSKAMSDMDKEVDAFAAVQEQQIDAASKVAIKKSVNTPIDMVELMDELDTYAKTGEVSEDSKFIREKTEEEIESGDRRAAIDIPGFNPEANTADDEPDDVEVQVDDNHKRMVEILIDKTGYGDGQINLSDEEREKVATSSLIRVKEVEEINLSTLKVRRASKSFLEEVQTYQTAHSVANIAFPASRFTAQMKGLTYGEMGDISFDPEKVRFEQVRMRLSIIYNKMINPSCGKFESFEDFLRKFAYVDIDFALFGLVVATFPEIDDISMTCNNPSCKKPFTHKFSPRTLISYDHMSDKILEIYNELSSADLNRLTQMLEESPARVTKLIRLPISGYVLKIGIASAYDYLYTVLDNVIGDKFTENHPEDVNGILQLNSTLLNLIRGVLIPDGSGSYMEFDTFEDMVQALYTIKPEEIQILGAILQKYYDAYSVRFMLKDVVCPHCGSKTKRVPLDIGYLLFLKYQRLMSTELELDSISVL